MKQMRWQQTAPFHWKLTETPYEVRLPRVGTGFAVVEDGIEVDYHNSRDRAMDKAQMLALYKIHNERT